MGVVQDDGKFTQFDIGDAAKTSKDLKIEYVPVHVEDETFKCVTVTKAVNIKPGQDTKDIKITCTLITTISGQVMSEATVHGKIRINNKDLVVQDDGKFTQFDIGDAAKTSKDLKIEYVPLENETFKCVTDTKAVNIKPGQDTKDIKITCTLITKKKKKTVDFMSSVKSMIITLKEKIQKSPQPKKC